jgi:AhpC/TSA family/Disulphide bond corrector protein DsbC
VQLQDSLPDLHRRGLGLAAISYDSPETLQAFARQRGITYPLLSDQGSSTIRRYHILNTSATGRTAGIPHPGTFVLDRNGVVVSRSFEERYQERAGAGSLAFTLQDPPPAGAQRVETPHLVLTWWASDTAAAPGTRLGLVLDVTPKPKMHVYAPGQQDLIPISLTIDAVDGLRLHKPEYPKPERYFFAPLKETQLVYSHPFKIRHDVTVEVTPAIRARAKEPNAALTIAGTLRYQACDDNVCYMPQSIPVSWTVRLQQK